MLEHSVEVRTTPDKIWEFFVNLDQNYTMWHPDDHIVWKWSEGPPLEQGSTIYAEQYMLGELTKYHAQVAESIPQKKIVFTFSFPMSMLAPKLEWRIEEKGSYSLFTAITYLKAGKLFRTLFKKQFEELIEGHNQHVAKEGEILKTILENQS